MIEKNLSILRRIGKTGAATVAELRDELELHDARERINCLKVAGYVETCVGDTVEYAPTAKGWALLRKMDAPMGAMPLPRTGPDMNGPPYLGEPEGYVRPEGRIAYTMPHMENGIRKERTRPAIIGVRAVEGLRSHSGQRV